LNRFLLFFIGILTTVKIDLVGQLMAAEILILIYFIVEFKSIIGYLRNSTMMRQIIKYATMYLLSQIVTDLYMNTSTNDMMRGWSKIIMLCINLVTLFYLIPGNTKYLIYFGLGFCLGKVISISFGIGEYVFLWKFGWGPTLSLLFVLVLSLTNRIGYKQKALLIIGLSLVHFFMNARSLGGITLFSGILMLIPDIVRKQIDTRNLLGWKQLLLGSGLLYLFITGYSLFAGSGFLGEEAKEKYEMQTKNGENILSGGRGEYLASIPAIMDSPILGHGSWAKNSKYIKGLLVKRGEDFTNPKFYEMIENGLIPTHSHLFGGWVEAGFLGFVFWFVVFKLVLRGILLSVKYELLKSYPFIVFTLLTFIWDIPFSPFGLERRIINPYYIIIAIIMININHCSKRTLN
jgi:hypothetical protein